MNDDLLNRYLIGETTPEERVEVYEWIESSKENKEIFNSLRKIQDLVTWQDSDSSAKPIVRRRNIFFTMVQIAALFVLFFGAYKLLNPLLIKNDALEIFFEFAILIMASDSSIAVTLNPF